MPRICAARDAVVTDIIKSGLRDNTSMMVKKYVWKVQNIPAGIHRDGLLALFKDPERLRVKSICPDFDRPKCSIATVEYDPWPEHPTASPALRETGHDMPHIDRDFWGFTPIYHPESGDYDSEYACLKYALSPVALRE